MRSQGERQRRNKLSKAQRLTFNNSHHVSRHDMRSGTMRSAIADAKDKSPYKVAHVFIGKGNKAKPINRSFKRWGVKG
jgi:hypothetical protein